MKTKMILIACLFVAGFIFTSCQKDNDLISDNSFGNVEEEMKAQNPSPGSGLFETVEEARISNFPDPFERFTTIEYEVPKAAFVTIDVRNLTEGYVFTLLREYKEAGQYHLVFDSKNHPPGSYLVQLITKPKSVTDIMNRASDIMTKKVKEGNGNFNDQR